MPYADMEEIAEYIKDMTEAEVWNLINWLHYCGGVRK